MTFRRRLSALFSIPGLAAILMAAPGHAQDPAAQGGGWDTPRALDLVEAARRVRQSSAVDTSLTSYQSRAQGFVYFFLDRADEEEHTLIKADQIALDVFWRAPDQTRQRIVGMRDEEVLPTNIRYHLDHLTVVQDDFQDLIRMGDGDEVGAVLHPVAPGAEATYRYRLADSLSLQYVGLAEPVRVYEVQVQPRDVDLPGFVGALYLDRTTGAIVRMAFTFTPASYVDPYLDYIRISLDNALWMGKHWLPYRQEVELRRELPQLDFMAGSIIRGRWEVGEYEFNQELPDFLFSGPRVTAAPERLRESFVFSEDLYADLDREGLAPSPSLEEVQQQVRSMALAGAVQGLGPVRLYLSSFSDAVRRNRVEGWTFGLGANIRLGGRPFRVLTGYATAAGKGWLEGELRIPRDFGSVTLGGHWNRLTDMGPVPGASRLVNTLATLGGRDYQDPYWSTGGTVTWIWRVGRSSRVEVRGSLETHRSGVLQVDGSNTAFRPVRPVVEGTLRAGELAVVRNDDGAGFFGESRLRVGHVDGVYSRLDARVGWSRRGPSTTLDRWVGVRAGWASSGAPAQELFLLGGRATLPGYPYRATVGDGFVLAEAWVRRAVVEPWISLRLTGAGGWSRLPGDHLPEGWDAVTDPGVRTSLGAGVDLLWEVIQLDVARGLSNGGDWTFYLSVSPRLTPWL